MGRWESASFELGPEQLRLGLGFTRPTDVASPGSLLARGYVDVGNVFTWTPAGEPGFARREVRLGHATPLS
jgi:hypothetical protein